MNTSTQAMNNVSKVQATPTSNKPNTGKQTPELNFTELFSSALSQSAPAAQLNSIESQLRESLYKQDKPKKSSDSTANAEAAQAAQSAVWAQRNWMQTPAVPQAAPSTATTNTEPVKQASVPESTTRATEKTTNNNPENNAESQSASNDSAPTADSNKTAESSETLNTAPGDDQRAPALASNATNTAVQEKPQAGSPSLAGNLQINTSTGEKPVSLPTAQTGVEPNTATEQASTAPTRPDLKTTAQLKAEAILSNSTAPVRNDANTPANIASAAGNSNSVAAQLAPQIAPQIAQQAQAQGEGFGEEGLKVGQKILAAGSLQTSSAGTALAAGTNGLNGTAANGQQTLIKTPVNQPGFAKELGQTVQWAIGKNLSTVDIRVNPESFGPMNMRLVQKGQQVQLVIRTQDEASANLLTQALGGLKEVLAQNGLQLNQVQVQHGNNPNQQSQTNQGQAQFEQNQGHGGQGNSQHNTSGSDNSQQEQGTAATTATNRKPEGKLDLFA